MAQSLLRETGPLLTSSANISGFKGSITVEGIALDFPFCKNFGSLSPGKKVVEKLVLLYFGRKVEIGD